MINRALGNHDRKTTQISIRQGTNIVARVLQSDEQATYVNKKNTSCVSQAGTSAISVEQLYPLASLPDLSMASPLSCTRQLPRRSTLADEDEAQELLQAGEAGREHPLLGLRLP
jgi:hypothetical protein